MGDDIKAKEMHLSFMYTYVGRDLRQWDKRVWAWGQGYKSSKEME